MRALRVVVVVGVLLAGAGTASAHPVEQICTSSMAISWWGLVESMTGWNYYAWKYPGYAAGAYSISTCGRVG